MAKAIVATRAKGSSKWFYSIIVNCDPDEVKAELLWKKRLGMILITIRKARCFPDVRKFADGIGYEEPTLPTTATEIRRIAKRYKIGYIFWHDSNCKGLITKEKVNIIHD